MRFLLFSVVLGAAWLAHRQVYLFLATASRNAVPADTQASLVAFLARQCHRAADKAESLKPPSRYAQIGTWNWPTRYGTSMTEDDFNEPPELLLRVCADAFCAAQRAAADNGAAAPVAGSEPAPALALAPAAATEPAGAATEAGAGAGAAADGAAPTGEDATTRLSPHLRCPSSFAADCVRCIAYHGSGGLLPHQDMFMKHVLSVSLGSTCVFRYGESYDGEGNIVDPVAVRLHSGDAMLFNGQALPHSVSDIDADTRPEWWTSAVSERDDPDGARLLERTMRLNVQCRDRSSIAAYGK